MTRFNIKGRLATLGKKNADIISELCDRGISCSASEFSVAIHGDSTPKSDRICSLADEIISGWEKKDVQ